MRDEELQERVEKMLAAPMLTVRRERKGRQTEDDIRPAIRTLSLTSTNGHLRAELATHPRGVRPGDLVAALGAPAVPGRACRTHQWIERDGARFEPLPVSVLGTDGDATQHARRAFPHVRDGNQSQPGGSPPGATRGAAALALPTAPRAAPRPRPAKPKIGDTRPAPVRGGTRRQPKVGCAGRSAQAGRGSSPQRTAACRRGPSPLGRRRRRPASGPAADAAPGGTASRSRWAGTWSACTSSPR